MKRKADEVSSSTSKQLLVSFEELEADPIPLDNNFEGEELNRMFEDDFEKSDTLFNSTLQAAAQLGQHSPSQSFSQQSPLEAHGEQSATPAKHPHKMTVRLVAFFLTQRASLKQNFPSLTAAQQLLRCLRRKCSTMFTYDLQASQPSCLEQPPPPVRHHSPPPPHQMLKGSERT